MREKASFTEDLRGTISDARSERLWEALRAAAPDPQTDAAQTERGQAILMTLLAEPTASSSMASALWREFRLLPVSGLALTSGLTLLALTLELLVPPPVVRGRTLAWIALAAPWLGVLWGLTVAPLRHGAWSDWRAMAPLRIELLMVSRLGAVAAVSVLIAATLALGGVPSGTTALTLALSWAGPFALGAVLMVLFTWRFSAALALTLSAAAWGVPLVVAVTSNGRLALAGAALTGYVPSLGGGGALALDSLMLLAACALGVWLARRGAAWILN